MNYSTLEKIKINIELFKDGYISIIDLFNCLNIDLIDKDIEDLQKLIEGYLK